MYENVKSLCSTLETNVLLQTIFQLKKILAKIFLKKKKIV